MPAGPPPPPPARPSPPEGFLDPPAPPRDVDLIFRTIEQLTLKLNRLKVRAPPQTGEKRGGVLPSGCQSGETVPTASHPVSWPPQALESAHRQLLCSLGGSAPADVTLPGGSAPQTDGWAQRPPSPDGDSPLSRALRCLQGPAANAPGESRSPSAPYASPHTPPSPQPPHLQVPV